MKKFTTVMSVVVALVALLGFTVPAFAASGGSTLTAAQLAQEFQTTKNASALYSSLTPLEKAEFQLMYTPASTVVTTGAAAPAPMLAAATSGLVIPMTSWIWQEPFEFYLAIYGGTGLLLYTFYSEMYFQTSNGKFTAVYDQIWGTVDNVNIYQYLGVQNHVLTGGIGCNAFNAYAEGKFAFNPFQFYTNPKCFYPIINIFMNAQTHDIVVSTLQKTSP